ncbi:hypothetical protein [Dyella sp. SG609]|uniref:M949_RS01915 family surface polysaccharide biosynthesis protein n=1 Tax=Dyella sp. SG609 TaxID=2587018 RepID=UPI0014463AC8|nr:hypothetical protein [Dyella sp. SG609]NKJ23353.1 hypothetical protein [Dyella sp. SG609]
MKRFATLLLSAFIFSTQASPIAQPITAAQLPAGITFKGNFKQALRWTDAEGDNLVVVSMHSDDNSEYGYNDDLYAVRYTLAGGKAQLRWSLHDYVHDCGVDHQATFFRGAALQVTDLDGNGTAEVWMAYRLMCRGDISSDTMKVIAYQGAQKYAMRGETRDAGGQGGSYVFDTAFLEAPRPLREFARKLWAAHVADAPDGE